jgi:hypothetical protein
MGGVPSVGRNAGVLVLFDVDVTLTAPCKVPRQFSVGGMAQPM